MKMRAKLFATLSAFVLTALVLLWSFQVLLLDTFFYQITKNRMTSAAVQIEALYNAGDADFTQNVYATALNNEFCISVFGPDGRLLTTADVGGGCIIHVVDDKTLNELYQKAVASGGEYFHRAGLTGFQNGEERATPFTSRYSVRDRILYISVKDTPGGALIMLFDARVHEKSISERPLF